MSELQIGLSIVSGGIVGFALGLLGATGAYIGSLLGKAVPSKSLLFLFALLMLFMAYRMVRIGFKRPRTNGIHRLFMRQRHCGLTLVKP